MSFEVREHDEERVMTKRNSDGTMGGTITGETIFDHAPTASELDEVVGDPDLTRDDYLAVTTDADAILVDLWDLFTLRGDARRARKFLNRIQDEELKRSLTYRDVIN